MSIRQLFTVIFALTCASSIGCCGMMQRYGGGCGGQVYDSCCPSCGVAEPGCCCPEPACGCGDQCCEPGCGCCDACCEPACGCCDACCEPTCGCGDVGCGTAVGSGTPVGCCPILGDCWFLRRLRQAWWGFSGCSSGCSGETYWSEWHNDPPCNCQSGGRASYGGGHYGGPYGRRAFLAEQHQNISEELRFADEGSGPTFR